MPNLSAVNASAVNASATSGAGGVGGDSFRLGFDLRRVVAATAPYTLALDLRQIVYEVNRVGVDLRQVVSVPTMRVGVDLRQVVTAGYRIGIDLGQMVINGLVAAGAGTQRVQATVMLADIDVSDAITGVIEIDREEGAAAVAEFTLRPAVGPIDLVHWLGATVRIDVSVNGAPPRPLFVGRVTDPDYDAVTRTTTFRATDGLQNILDAAPESVVDMLAGGYWSPAVFAADATGTARAQDRLSTIPESLDLSPAGFFRRTPWAAKDTPDYTFTPDSIIDQSLRVEPGPWREMLNTIELTVELRYTRHRHRQRSYHWTYGPGFHNWIVDQTTLPTQDMIRRAAEANSWRLTSEHFVGQPVTVNPQTGAVEWQVINGVLWRNDGRTNTFVLEATLGAYVRWDETITETYHITVQAPASVTRFGVIKQTDYVSLASTDDGLDWTATPVPTAGALGGESAPALSGGGIGTAFPDLASAGTAPNGDRYLDTLDVAAAENAMITAMARAYTRVLAAHRANTVEFAVPLLPYIDLPHTVRIDTDPITAQGKVRQIVHRIDSGGQATTTVRLAVSQASMEPVSGWALTLPPRVDTIGLSPAASVPALGGSETHLGRRWYSPPENPDWTGYVGNYVLPNPVTAPAYSERFVIDWGAISRDPIAATRELPQIVAVPHETLEIAA